MYNNCGVNKVFLVGTVSAAPYWRKKAQHPDVLCFKLITQENIGKPGLPVEHLETHSIRVQEKNVLPGLKQGQSLHVEGKIYTISFIDEQGIRRYKTEVVAHRITLLNEAPADAV